MNKDDETRLYDVTNKIKKMLSQRAFIFNDDSTDTKDKTIIKSKCYGTNGPETLTEAVEGQLYFHIQE